MNITGFEVFEELLEYHQETNSIKDKYSRLRSLLERACKDITSTEKVQFSNLFSRLNYTCDKTGLDKFKTYRLNTFRIHANKVLHAEFNPTKEDYLQDLKSLCNGLSHFYKVPIPTEIITQLPKSDQNKPIVRRGEKHERLRVEVTSTDRDYIYAIDETNATEDPIRIKYGVAGINEEFNSSLDSLWKGCQLNLIDVSIDANGLYLPDFIIIEPDYLIDISAIAENFKEYGSHPLNYIQSKFAAIQNTAPILLGNFANNALDDFLFADKSDVITVAKTFERTFKQYPFDFSTCQDLYNKEKEDKFKEDVKLQFLNIQNVVTNTFNEDGYNIDRLKATVEPSFICEKLGIQGRMDLLQDDFKNLIELKSGRASDFVMPVKSKENNYIQMQLYRAVIQLNFGKQYQNIASYLLYSKYPFLFKEQHAWNIVKKALNVRNLIVANECLITRTPIKTEEFFDQIEPEILNTNSARNKLWENYQKPQILEFKKPYINASKLEQTYFHSLYSFVTKEHYFSKLQIGKLDEERNESFWIDFAAKKNNGEILYDLTISPEGCKTAEETPCITLQIPDYDQDYLPNFRKGDIVILYQRNSEVDNVTNKQIFKGSIQALDPKEITIRLRFKQQNKSVLPITSKYAVEHDFLDSSYSSMYKGLYAFLNATQDRRNLLLNLRQPRQDITSILENKYDSEELQQIISKAKNAKDYFLLIGPPGTGKTSIALKSMVEEFYSEESNNILLLSYTNRAVDEICDALDNVKTKPSYIRIGSQLSCAEKHHKRLLDVALIDCKTRVDVRKHLESVRIFVGTVASVSGKTELFKVKHFHVAIIDEASQILEPNLLGILSAKTLIGGNAIDKFILIGDQKQLPAVVIQGEEDSRVIVPELNAIGLFNHRNSLFERFYNLHKSDKKSLIWGMLHKQGRMHPDISLFPNYAFYNNQLEVVPTPHQQSELEFKIFDKGNSLQRLTATKRLAFIPGDVHKGDKSKTNSIEAKIVARLVENIFDLYKQNNLAFSTEEAVGIITPYRSQIALIKKEIHKLNISELNKISVDTVERFQGSQRDIIIYSFSVNQFGQLDWLSNNIEDDGQTIDRKLNVAITRARKQLFVTGNPTILSNNLIYYKLIEFIRSKHGYIDASPVDFLKGNFNIYEPNTEVAIGGKIYEPDQEFKSVFDRLVINPIIDLSPKYPEEILGNTHDYNRLNLLEFGRTQFDQATLECSSYDKVNLYCFYNMRKHYFSSIAIFKSFDKYFKSLFLNTGNRITFLDFGCGPMTSGLAFNQHFGSDDRFHFNYIGIDIANSMLVKAKEFSDSELFHAESRFQFKNSFGQVRDDFWPSTFSLSNTVILNFSYLFANLTNEIVEVLARQINELICNYPLNKYVLIFQNSSIEKRNRTYNNFKKLVPSLSSISEPKTTTITYRNARMKMYDKTETVYYELLSN